MIYQIIYQIRKKTHFWSQKRALKNLERVKIRMEREIFLVEGKFNLFKLN